MRRKKEVGLTSKMPSSIVGSLMTRDNVQARDGPGIIGCLMHLGSLLPVRENHGRILFGDGNSSLSHELYLGHLFTTGIRKPFEEP